MAALEIGSKCSFTECKLRFFAHFRLDRIFRGTLRVQKKRIGLSSIARSSIAKFAAKFIGFLANYAVTHGLEIVHIFGANKELFVLIGE